MELKLYNYLRKQGLTNEYVDFRERIYQEKLEKFDTGLGMENPILSSIKKHLKTYNAFLKSIQSQEIHLRYYQILALYFSELYFQKKGEHGFSYAQNSLAYWMATGSGKTIIMHLNILQYLSHCKKFKDFEIIMTTPGVNLIEQHERELTPFLDFLNGKYRNRIRLTIDTTQALTNKPDDFFVYPASKTYKRLILVDEAHIGLSTTAAKGTDGAFIELRKRLNINDSFLFEYSATFHNINSTLEKDYEKSIVFDYNYNLFYKDGYGKDYFFQDVKEDVLQGNEDEKFADNFYRNLDVINEKIELWKTADYKLQKDIFKATTPPDKPLIAFMGNTVNNKSRSNNNQDDEVSDITKIINFLANLSSTQKEQYTALFNQEHTGKLTLTRNPETDDEILLSYGNGGYWGIVNVGNGAKFINGLENENIIKNPRNKIIISNIERYSFKNIDLQTSPINVLIGSRKFAEGWNCFRVSVIGLINLGSSKGNKIIQIFGRGVRIKGIKNDGKRTFPEHNPDYFKLSNDKENDKLKKIETLCIFSLKKSYLETFTKAVNNELEIQKRYEIEVNPSIIQLNDQTEIKFEEFRKRIPIFKLSKSDIGQRRVQLKPLQSFTIRYKEGTQEKTGTVNNFNVKLDYRPDKLKQRVDIKGSLSNFIRDYAPFINLLNFKTIVSEFQEETGLHISHKQQELTPMAILSYIEEINYKGKLKVFDIDFINNLIIQMTTDFLKKLKNKVNWYINNSNYEYNQLLKQSTETKKGDFIDKYYILKTITTTKEIKGKTSFKKKHEIDAEIQAFDNNIAKIADRLKVDNIGNHIYNPLLREALQNAEDEADLKISPDKLNTGEKKFIEDAANFFKDNPKYTDFEVYLMRNVESLKSIGIYLNDDSQVFYPDFILWLIGKDKIHINFIDPKGQMGMQDSTTLLENEKVKIANKKENDTLVLLEKELSKVHKKPVEVNSFLLLRDSSNMGTIGKSLNVDWQKENMIAKNILRLNWHDTLENGSQQDSSKLPDGKNYLEWMLENTLN